MDGKCSIMALLIGLFQAELFFKSDMPTHPFQKERDKKPHMEVTFTREEKGRWVPYAAHTWGYDPETGHTAIKLSGTSMARHILLARSWEEAEGVAFSHETHEV